MIKSPKLGLIIAPLAGALSYMLLAFIFGEDHTPKKDYTGLQAWPFYVTMYVTMALLCYNEKHLFIPLLFFAGYGAVMGAVVSATYCWLSGITTHSNKDALQK